MRSVVGVDRTVVEGATVVVACFGVDVVGVVNTTPEGGSVISPTGFRTSGPTAWLWGTNAMPTAPTRTSAIEPSHHQRCEVGLELDDVTSPNLVGPDLTALGA